MHEYLILGAGPAGLQLGYFLKCANRDYLILEAGDSPGTYFKSYPRHRQLLSINKVHTGFDDPEVNLRWDWNSLLSDNESLRFANYSRSFFPDADDLVRYLADFTEQHELAVEYNTRVEKISRGAGFHLTDENGRVFSGRRLVVATGVSQLYMPPIEGIELAESYESFSVDPEDFANQRVLIVGKGNSGFETADSLMATTSLIHIASPNPISLAWQTHFVGHLRAVNNNLLDTYQLKIQNAVLDADIERIRRLDNGQLAVSFKYAHAGGESEDLHYDRVLLCTGFKFDAEIFDEDCRPNLIINDRFPEMTSAWESTNVEDMYFAGTLMQARDFKKAASSFIHGFRYNVKALHRILETKYHEQSWPSRTISADPETLTQAIIQRVNQTSALWQMFGFLCDVIVVSDRDQSATIYEELPEEYVKDTHFSHHAHYYTLKLEFGESQANPFKIDRAPDPEKAERSTFLHPVIRRYDHGHLVSEQHILEDLEADWSKDVHRQPLLSFFETQCAPVLASA